jgi:hypothetical protein
MKCLTAMLATFAAALLLCSPAPAGAHRPFAAWQAQEQVYNIWHSHCGNGWAWFCVNPNVMLSTVAVGDHSWQVWYTWQEARFDYLPNSRACRVVVRVNGHVGGVEQYYETEHCWS